MVRTNFFSSLHHPCIVQFLGISFDGEKYCIVSELMGASLYDFLHHSWDQIEEDNDLRKNIVFNIAQGMNYLHTRKPPVLHRDLSSRNILLHPVSFQAKVADFGLALAKEDISHPFSSFTGAGMIA